MGLLNVEAERLVAQVAALTGLTGTALVAYIILSEGSRFVFWPRNLLLVP